VVHLTKSDVAIGVLPFFHSYGYTATLWPVLALDPKGVYHFSPLEGRQVGKLCGKHRATLLMTTPTFLRLYLKSCQPEDFSALDVVFASAEKLPVELANAFEEKFGVRPVEAYGATELSPLVSVNVPASRSAGGTGAGCKEGTVGRPIPGVAAKIVHPETGAELGRDEPGLLLIKGPNVMQGYYKRPDLTAKVMRDTWYVTGDMALIDSEGFIRITGRESRFSKIGGEMVPHILIEETLQKVLSSDEEELRAVVTAVPDAKKGERLVVLHTPLDRSPAAIGKELAESGLPNLWIPSADSFFPVDHIPVLGTGKLDLKAIKDLALAKVRGETS
jgi:acyl-[acyl-carrier-protein]-phospholipid O-acyltransferase/long-chain-fatty-acid--[acyl-carrier-protein] ligase